MKNLGTVDLLVIGGGVNGAGIARDAVGRGLSVVLCEKGDLAEGTSSRSGTGPAGASSSANSWSRRAWPSVGGAPFAPRGSRRHTRTRKPLGPGIGSATRRATYAGGSI